MAVLVLLGLLLTGMGYQYVQRNMRAVPVGAYADVDSLLHQGSALWQAEQTAETGSSGEGKDSAQSGQQSLSLIAVEMDLNSATAAELERLPRIGPTLAARIVAYRDAHGPFERVQDLTRVSGIGDKTLLKLEGLVHVGRER